MPQRQQIKYQIMQSNRLLFTFKKAFSPHNKPYINNAHFIINGTHEYCILEIRFKKENETLVLEMEYLIVYSGGSPKGSLIYSNLALKYGH